MINISRIAMCVVALLLLVCACERSVVTDSARDLFEQVSVSGSIVSTRTYMDDLSPCWNEDDQVAFFTSDHVLCPPFISDEGGSTSTSFSGEKPSGSSLAYAVYPYYERTSFSADGIVASLDGKQDGDASCAIMAACGNESDGFQFRNVCSLVKVNVPETMDAVSIGVYRDDRVSGVVYLNPTQSSVGVNCTEPSSIAEHRVEVEAASGVLSGEVLLALLPSKSDILNLYVTRSDGKVALVSRSLPSGKPFTSGSLKNLGTLSNLDFGVSARITDPTYSQL